MMAEEFDSSSEQNFIMYTTSTAAAGTAVTLKNEAGNTLISETIPCGFSSIVLSTPELRLGEVCTISIGGGSEEVTVDNTSASGGFGMAGMFGGGMRGGDRFMQGGQNQNWARDDAADETSAISPDALVMVGVSVLFLLAGLVIAFKVKH